MGGATSKSTFIDLTQTLLSREVDSTDHEFWDELWKTILTTEEIFEVLTPDNIRKLIAEKPENVNTVFTQAVAQLYQLVETPFPIYFEQALNCARILTRILPYLLETDSRIVQELLWSKRYVKNIQSAALENGEEQVGPDDFQESEPLAVILVNTLFHLMFLPDFTIDDPNTEFVDSDVETPAFKNALMWAPGVGSVEKTIVSSTQFDTNRIDILRLMIASFSDSLYQSADHYDSCASLWLEVATSVDAPYCEIVFYSLVNTVLGYDPIGWGIPYGNVMATDTAKTVMESAIQTLIILLDYGHPFQYDSNKTNNSSNLPYVSLDDTRTQGYNVFRRFLGSIEDPEQLNFMYRGFVRLLNNAHQAESTYLPYSITRVGIEQELLILFWKCLEENPHFMPYILKNCDIGEILVPICYFMLEGRKDPAKVGLMYLCTFTLLKLSGERNFGVALNKSYNLHLPVDVPLFSGNHADLLIIVLHKMIVSGLEKLSALYSCFLTIICNVSPYCKSLCTVAAVKLVNLFQIFVSPRFLYAAESNHVYVGLLLETFNNIIQYQYEGNGNLIYSIIRRREIFEGLFNLTLPVAIQHASEQHNGESAKTKPKSANIKKASSNEDTTSITTQANPTGLISTENVERVVDNEGEIKDVKSPEADNRAQLKVNKSPVDIEAAVTGQVLTGRFVPSEQWLQSVKSELPLNTIIRLLKSLIPQIDEMTSKTMSVDENHVIEFIKSTTMVGLLPVPHPIVIRKYQPNKYTCLWFTAYLWGVVFMHNQSLPLFDGRNVKLFIVQTV